jgi:hypothetical protein
VTSTPPTPPTPAWKIPTQETECVPKEDLFVTPTKKTDTRRLIISLKPPEQPAIELDEDSTGTLPPAKETESDEAELEEASENNWDSDWTDLGVKKRSRARSSKRSKASPQSLTQHQEHSSTTLPKSTPRVPFIGS